ncbi:MAG: DUF1249 domain-containing protein [Candidatus Heimdallarchaeum aukensis]|uniref:DUF1249 domain-containing protein n=1 Tax=Candidatus Heimdallarchaeum aukensis TaxID=2876573 RepID=A0A9Y1BM73_9ARCH|nr:MAG: DUF1249 domain-containing protein [Candidatus Heimdallarchaeum aukensis]
MSDKQIITTIETIFHKNYDLLMKLIPNVEEIEEKLILYSGNLMELHISILSRDESEMILSMGHYFLQNDDLVPDPEVVIRIDSLKKIAEVLSYKDQYLFSVVYPSKSMVDTESRDSLNSFLNLWLKRMLTEKYNRK